MSYLAFSNMIDGRTGETLSEAGAADNEHAVLANAYIYATAFTPGLEGLPQGARLTVDAFVDLKPLRLDRSEGRDSQKIFSFEEVKAALAHPEVTPEAIIEQTKPPERGHVLAVHKAITRWIAWVEHEWQDRAQGEALSGLAAETIDPILLDLYEQTYVPTTRQIRAWLEGEAKAIPASVARTAKQILAAAHSAWTDATARALDDQLAAVATHEGINHVWTVVPPTREPNALQCADRITKRWYPIGKARVLWRPTVNLASSGDEVRITLMGGEREIAPATLTVNRQTASVEVVGNCTTIEHASTQGEVDEAAQQIAERLQAHIREVRLGRSARERDWTFRELCGKPISDAHWEPGPTKSETRKTDRD